MHWSCLVVEVVEVEVVVVVTFLFVVVVVVRLFGRLFLPAKFFEGWRVYWGTPRRKA